MTAQPLLDLAQDMPAVGIIWLLSNSLFDPFLCFRVPALLIQTPCQMLLERGLIGVKVRRSMELGLSDTKHFPAKRVHAQRVPVITQESARPHQLFSALVLLRPDCSFAHQDPYAAESEVQETSTEMKLARNMTAPMTSEESSVCMACASCLSNRLHWQESSARGDQAVSEGDSIPSG